MTIRIYPSRLEGEPIETHETTELWSVSDWFLSVAPSFSLDAENVHPTVRLNCVAIDPSEWPLTFFRPEDQIDIYIEPRGEGVAAVIYWAAVIIFAIASIVMARRAGDGSDQRRGRNLDDPGAMANTPRYGEAIPEIAGSPLTYPDYLAPPRRYYTGLTQQWVDQLVCIGAGEFQKNVAQVYIGDTPAPLLGDNVEVAFYEPGEIIPAPFREIWHSPAEVGFTTFGGAGLTLGPATNINRIWSSWIMISGTSVSSTFPPPASWEPGMSVRIDAAHPIEYAGNWVSSAVLDALGVTIGDEVEITGVIDGTYAVSGITAASGGVPGNASTVTGSAPPSRFDFGTTHATLGISLGSLNYTVSLTATVTDLVELVSTINAQLNASPVRARATSGALEMYQLEPYTGESISVSGDTVTLLGSTPTIVDGSAASPAVARRYHMGSAEFPTGNDVASAGLEGMLYQIETISGNSLSVVPIGQSFWSGFPPNVDGSRSNIQISGDSIQGGWIGPFVPTPRGELSDAFEVDIFFPQGLIRYNKEGRTRSRGAGGHINWRFIGESEWNYVPFWTEQATPDQIGFTYRVDHAPGRVEVRVKAENAPSDNARHSDLQQWTGLRARILGAPESYPGMTTMSVRLRSGDKVSGTVENQISVRPTRILPTVEDPEVSAPTRDIAPFLIHMMSSVGYGRNFLDMDHIRALHQIWHDREDYFDLAVSGSSTLKTVANYCLAAGFAELTIRRGKLTPVRDAYRIGSPARIYSPQENSAPLTEQTQSVMPDDIDGVDVEYEDYVTGRILTESYRLPTDEGRRVELIKVPGVTGATQAWRLAARRRRTIAYRRTAYKGATELAAMNSDYMDFVGLQDGIPEYGQSAFAIAVDGLTITLSEPVQSVEGQPIARIRGPDGVSSPPVFITGISGHEITLQGMPTGFVVDTRPGSATVVYLGSRTQITHDALMTEIRPGADGRVEFQAVNMDNRVYLEDDMGPNQVVLTSKPYPYFGEPESLGVGGGIARLHDNNVVVDSEGGQETLAVGGSIVGLALRSVNFEAIADNEPMVLGGDVTALRFHNVLVPYTHAAPEGMLLGGGITGIKLSKVLVPYTHPDPEVLELGGAITRIYLHAP